MSEIKARVISNSAEGGLEIECDLCDGAGEIRAYSDMDGSHHSVGCPFCMEIAHEQVIQGMVQSRADLQAENERLRAIVDRLPKTADGIALCDGLKVWFYSDTNALLRGIVQYWDEFHVLVMSNAGGCYWLKHAGQAEMPAELWSTREAAEAAMQEPTNG